MARYLGPTCRLSRREGSDLGFKSGLKSIENKCRFNKLPGRFGDKRNKASEYCLQLREKQKLKRTYGLLEKQFKGYFERSLRIKGSSGENLLKLLEQRLDNVVFKMGFACTRAEARQLVSHRSVLVNDKLVSIASYQVSAGDSISIKQASKKQSRIQISMELVKNKGIPEWLEVDKDALTGIFLRSPTRSELPAEINDNLIIELYSK